ncbi:MAG: hypothetical protein ACE5KH_00100 [Candidatus Geothermarchaeales archaeon]
MESRILRWVPLLLGGLFVVSSFLPLGVYHSLEPPDIRGFLYPYQLPLGYATLATGFTLLVRSRGGLQTRLKTPMILTLSGLVVLTALYVPAVALSSDYFINLWHGTRLNYDVDFYGLLTAPPFYLGLTSLILGLVLRREEAIR